MREVHIVIAAHEVKLVSDAPEDSLEDMAARALGLIEETKVEARRIPTGFDIGGASGSAERTIFTGDPGWES